jgi:hypothetical protein
MIKYLAADRLGVKKKLNSRLQVPLWRNWSRKEIID